MTAMATLWQANDGFRQIGALFFEINGTFHFTLSILQKFRKIHKNIYPFIFNLAQEITSIYKYQG